MIRYLQIDTPQLYAFLITLAESEQLEIFDAVIRYGQSNGEEPAEHGKNAVSPESWRNALKCLSWGDVIDEAKTPGDGVRLLVLDTPKVGAVYLKKYATERTNILKYILRYGTTGEEPAPEDCAVWAEIVPFLSWGDVIKYADFKRQYMNSRYKSAFIALSNDKMTDFSRLFNSFSQREQEEFLKTYLLKNGK